MVRWMRRDLFARLLRTEARPASLGLTAAPLRWPAQNRPCWLYRLARFYFYTASATAAEALIRMLASGFHVAGSDYGV